MGKLKGKNNPARYARKGVSFLLRYLTCFIEIYASVALEELGLFLVAKVKHQDLLGQSHVLTLLLC
jgi:hypothetical protein